MVRAQIRAISALAPFLAGAGVCGSGDRLHRPVLHASLDGLPGASAVIIISLIPLILNVYYSYDSFFVLLML